MEDSSFITNTRNKVKRYHKIRIIGIILCTNKTATTIIIYNTIICTLNKNKQRQCIYVTWTTIFINIKIFEKNVFYIVLDYNIYLLK